MLLIQSQEYADAADSPFAKWQALARDSFKYELMPNTTHIDVLTNEEVAQKLAQYLSQQINRALKRDPSI